MLRQLSTLASATLLLSACEATHLYVAHTTVVGLDAAVNTQQTAGHLIIGYDRNFATVIPKSVPREDGNGKEAMAALSCSELKVDGIFLTGFIEQLATGDAALIFADKIKEDPKTRFFDCIDPSKD